MGYDRSYYESEDWQDRRQEALEAADGACEICGDEATQVHHLTYRRFGCEDPRDLQALCRACHASIHGYEG